MLRGSPGILHGHSLSHYWECSVDSNTYLLVLSLESTLEEYISNSVLSPESHTEKAVRKAVQEMGFLSYILREFTDFCTGKLLFGLWVNISYKQCQEKTWYSYINNDINECWFKVSFLRKVKLVQGVYGPQEDIDQYVRSMSPEPV